MSIGTAIVISVGMICFTVFITAVTLKGMGMGD
ncbi:hypothetical protein JOD45_002952 [Scopulibacillus daqui]|uniref:Uncharacterized protein n=1 Tax=Scopulibacillus daqui TaxID=1469162 RepID=A0ABS2Q345_9BACL|nr:hypothetical protein [Scopulibacillus daqui]